jgi:hypothetical protein
MKKLLFFLLITFLFSCELNKHCWECHKLYKETRSNTGAIRDWQTIGYPCHMTQDEINVYITENTYTTTYITASNDTVITKLKCVCLEDD